ncbi:hypothetical protein B0H10DRAFT_287385 [Mycena sp. CBHHK59/15]|nr:hypothetical protein B0H10DRAFT_287385 [Mycena sp. CBHHK59/15]
MDSITIFAAQRYSFVLKANQPINSYWIRANPNVGNTGFINGINSAILRYVGARAAEPTADSTASTLLLVETSLHPLVASPVPGLPYPGGADVNINLNVLLDFTALKFTVNGAVRLSLKIFGVLDGNLFVVQPQAIALQLFFIENWGTQV